jgi:hypothetical protein
MKKGGAGKRRKSRGYRGSRRLRGGAGYGATEALAPGAMGWGAAYDGAVDPKSGAAVSDPSLPAGEFSGIGGRRRKTAKKGGRKARRGTRKMRGGSNQISAMKAGYGFAGTGSAGLADAVSAPTSGGNAF